MITGLAGGRGRGDRAESSSSTEQANGTSVSAPLEYLNEKYSDPEMVDLLDMASLVDPRFKDAYIADDRKDFMKTRAVAEIQSLLEVQAATVTEPHTSTEAAADGAAAAEVAVSQSKRVKQSLGSFFKKASDAGLYA